MADINETTPISPVLPPSTKNRIGQGRPRKQPQRDRDPQQQRRPPAEPGHQVDEYA